MTGAPEFVVRCGRGLFLGLSTARVGSETRARRFASQCERRPLWMLYAFVVPYSPCLGPCRR